MTGNVPPPPEEVAYAREVGADALDRQKQEAAIRCAYCWAPDGQAHTGLCPNRPDDQEAPPAEQKEALF